MNISSSLLFFFSALGAFNGLLLSGYLLLTKPRTISNTFLSLLLLMISVRITKSVFFFFNPQLAGEFLQVGLAACFLIGPFLYFYCTSQQNKLSKLWLSWHWQLGLLIICMLATIWLVPYSRDSHNWHLIFKVINHVWLCFILMSAYVLRPIFIQWWRDKKLVDASDITAISVFVGVSLIWMAYFTSRYTSYIAGALSFSVVLYFNLMFFVLRRKALSAAPIEKYSDKKIDDKQAQQHISQLQTLLNEQHLYKDAQLTLSKVAKRMGVSSPYLSQLLNDNMKVTFTHFINEYRIELAKEMLKTNTRKVDDIADECGFNSTSTFYAVFKKHVQMTPSAFRKNAL